LTFLAFPAYFPRMKQRVPFTQLSDRQWAAVARKLLPEGLQIEIGTLAVGLRGVLRRS